MLAIKNIVKGYGPNEPILKDVSFELAKGEMAFLVGPSGAGKSTLIKLIYLEENPDSGEIIVGYHNFTRIKKRQIPGLRRQIGVIFQDFKLIAERTAYENIALALEVAGKPRREITVRVHELLRLVGLTHRKNNYPHQLQHREGQE